MEPLTEIAPLADDLALRQVIRRRLPSAQPVGMREFNNCYAGRTAYVVGRGPTQYRYEDLGSVRHPVFFINDAICLESHAKSDTFFFAHDAPLRPWLNGAVRSTVVIPADEGLLGEDAAPPLEHRGKVVLYHRRENEGDLLQLNRDELADPPRLYALGATIHSLFHFAWFCGITRLVLIGCDGLDHNPTRPSLRTAGYDPRLENRSSSSPTGQYSRIRAAQDLLANLLDLQIAYMGTPLA